MFHVIYNASSEYGAEAKNMQSDQDFCQFQELYIIPFPSLSSHFSSWASLTFIFGEVEIHRIFFKFGNFLRQKSNYAIVEN